MSLYRHLSSTPLLGSLANAFALAIEDEAGTTIEEIDRLVVSIYSKPEECRELVKTFMFTYVGREV
jgi:hypothetical protein